MRSQEEGGEQESGQVLALELGNFDAAACLGLEDLGSRRGVIHVGDL